MSGRNGRFHRIVMFTVFTLLLLALNVSTVFAAEGYTGGMYFNASGKLVDHTITLNWKKVKGAVFKIERREKNGDTWGAYHTLKDKLKKNTFKDNNAPSGYTYGYRITGKKGKRTVFTAAADMEKRAPQVLILDGSGRTDPGRVRSELLKAGCRVSLITDVSQEYDAEDYDGLVIPGGYSVAPEMYGAEKTNTHSKYGTIENDQAQIEAVRRFAKAGKPVLGVCRGSQIVNVAFYGTLNQCIGEKHTHYNGKFRNVTIKKDSWLYCRFGKKLKTLHSHHQAVKELGYGLIATQWDAKDRCIEAFEHRTLPVYGIQWHADVFKGSSKNKQVGRKTFEAFRSVCQQCMAH